MEMQCFEVGDTPYWQPGPIQKGRAGCQMFLQALRAAMPTISTTAVIHLDIVFMIFVLL